MQSRLANIPKIGMALCLMNPCILCSWNATIDALPKNFLYKIGLFHNALATKIPQSFLAITLISNFGTFLLYMMSCIIAIVAFHEHQMHSIFKHKLIPLFAIVANALCMTFYLVGPFFVPGMSKKEPLIALGFSAGWGVLGVIFFMIRSKKLGRSAMVAAPPTSVGA